MAQRTLRILCLGDSLTSGWMAGGSIQYPYQSMLEQTLKAALPDVEIETEVDGVPGDVTGFFLGRMLKHCE